jgi:hypothetical protein
MDKQETGWRPIETAPRDGRPILILDDECRAVRVGDHGLPFDLAGYRVGISFSDNSDSIPEFYSEAERRKLVVPPGWTRISHWCDLPPPPSPLVNGTDLHKRWLPQTAGRH